MRRAPARRSHSPPTSGEKLPRKGQPWVVLDWDDSQRVSIETLPFRATGQVQIRYTLWAKGESAERGHRWAYCDYNREDEASPFEVLRSASETAIEVRPYPNRRRVARFDKLRAAAHEADRTVRRVQFGHDIWVWRAELVAPASLGTAPVPSAPFPLVFVLDASHSQERNGGLATQLAIVQAYLANVPKAEVELVLAGRDAQRLFGRLVSAPDVGPSLPAGVRPAAARQRIRSSTAAPPSPPSCWRGTGDPDASCCSRMTSCARLST